MSELDPARNGCITASRISEMQAQGKGITRHRYACQLAAERMTGRPHRSSFNSAAMQHGNEFEEFAGQKYELRNGVLIEGTGKEFIKHPYIPFCGASPDRFVGEDGLVEIKNPETHTFFRYWQTGEIPADYRWQMLMQLACTQRKWCDWVAHDPDMPDEFSFIQVRFEPTRSEISDLERDLRFFNAEIDQIILSIKEKRKEP